MVEAIQIPSYNPCLEEDMAAKLRQFFPDKGSINSQRLNVVCDKIDALECSAERKVALRNQVVEFLVVEWNYPMGSIPMVLKGAQTCGRRRLALTRWQNARNGAMRRHPAGKLLAVAAAG